MKKGLRRGMLASLDANARIVLFVNAGQSFSSAISNVFVNMYLYRYLDGIAELSLFNVVQFVAIPTGFVLAAALSRRAGKRWSLVAGLAAFAAFYGLLLGLGERCAEMLLLLGAVNGLANGLFWFPFNIAMAEVVGDEARGRYYGAMSASGAALGALAPALSTLALELMPSEVGAYLLIFAVIGVASVVMAASCLRLTLVEKPVPADFVRHLRPRGDPGWRFCLIVNAVWGVRDGVNWSVMSAIVLESAGSDGAAGWLTLAFQLTGVAAFWLLSRRYGERDGLRYWGWGSILALGAALVTALWPTIAAAAIGGIGWRVADALVHIPFNAVFFGVFARFIRSEGGVPGRAIAAELWLNAGRLAGIGVVLGLSALTPAYARVAYALVTLAVPGTWFAYRRFAAASKTHAS